MTILIQSVFTNKTIQYHNKFTPKMTIVNVSDELEWTDLSILTVISLEVKAERMLCSLGNSHSAINGPIFLLLTN